MKPAVLARGCGAGERSEGRVFSTAGVGATDRFVSAFPTFARMTSWGLAFSLHCGHKSRDGKRFKRGWFRLFSK